MRALLPSREAGTTILTNMGAPKGGAAAQRTVGIARDFGLSGLKVACGTRCRTNTPFMDEPGTLRDIDLWAPTRI
jgi:hypothetical protein